MCCSSRYFRSNYCADDCADWFESDACAIVFQLCRPPELRYNLFYYKGPLGRFHAFQIFSFKQKSSNTWFIMSNLVIMRSFVWILCKRMGNYTESREQAVTLESGMHFLVKTKITPALDWQDLFGSAKNVDKFYLHQIWISLFDKHKCPVPCPRQDSVWWVFGASNTVRTL